jgi:hypothetical protein
MATTPQSKFTVVLPTVDNAVPPNPLVAGQVASLVFVIDTVTYTYAIPAGTGLGATITVPFAGLVPVFVPTAGTAYTADVEAVDANGDSAPSASLSWTQSAPVPAAPTFTVG